MSREAPKGKRKSQGRSRYCEIAQPSPEPGGGHTDLREYCSVALTWAAFGLYSGPLSRALQKVWVFRFFDPGPGGSGGPREAPQSPPWAFPGPPGASRRPPGPKTNQSKKPRNLKELTEHWSLCIKQSSGAKDNKYSSVDDRPGLCSGGVGSPVRPFARPPDRPETCENQRKTTKIIGQRPTTTKNYQNHRKTTKNALARSPVAKGGPA